MIEVTYVNHMGNDMTVVNAARVSFAKESTWDDYNSETEQYVLKDKDRKLVHYLAEHGHKSPLVKHKFLRWNEISRRYVDSEPEFYEPDAWRGRAEDKKQGSEGTVAIYMDQEMQWHRQLTSYTNLINNGVCPEQARMVLPQSMMTEWYWSGSLDAFADMCNLRCAGDTQLETRLVANQICDSMKELFPTSWFALRLEK